MNISRRNLAKLTVSAAVIAALPAVEAPAQAKNYGWSVGHSDYWETGFPDRASAIMAGSDVTEGDLRGFKTAEVIFYDLQIPDDCAGRAIEWLWEGGSIGNHMAEALVGVNEDGSPEGELSDAAWATSRETMGDEGRAAIAAALRRVGHAEVANLVGESRPIPEGDWEAIAGDAVLAAELRDSISRWAEKHNLEADLHGLMTRDVIGHSTVTG